MCFGIKYWLKKKDKKRAARRVVDQLEDEIEDLQNKYLCEFNRLEKELRNSQAHLFQAKLTIAKLQAYLHTLKRKTPSLPPDTKKKVRKERC